MGSSWYKNPSGPEILLALKLAESGILWTRKFRWAWDPWEFRTLGRSGVPASRDSCVPGILVSLESFWAWYACALKLEILVRLWSSLCKDQLNCWGLFSHVWDLFKDPRKIRKVLRMGFWRVWDPPREFGVLVMLESSWGLGIFFFRLIFSWAWDHYYLGSSKNRLVLSRDGILSLGPSYRLDVQNSCNMPKKTRNVVFIWAMIESSTFHCFILIFF